MRLEDLKAGAAVTGLAPAGIAKVIQVEWFGDQAVKVTFEDNAGTVRNRLVYRNEEPTLELVEAGRPWNTTYTRCWVVPNRSAACATRIPWSTSRTISLSRLSRSSRNKRFR